MTRYIILGFRKVEVSGGGEGGSSDAIWKPTVSANGDISWVKTSSTSKPLTQNIKGQDGYTPKKGTDYWNQSDIAEIHSYIDEQIGGALNGSY